MQYTSMESGPPYFVCYVTLLTFPVWHIASYTKKRERNWHWELLSDLCRAHGSVSGTLDDKTQIFSTLSLCFFLLLLIEASSNTLKCSERQVNRLEQCSNWYWRRKNIEVWRVTCWNVAKHIIFKVMTENALWFLKCQSTQMQNGGPVRNLQSLTNSIRISGLHIFWGVALCSLCKRIFVP